MRIRSFVIAYTLAVVALLLFADRRPLSPQQDHYSHVVDLTDTSALKTGSGRASSGTRIVAPADLIPGTWAASQIPAERLIAPLVVMNLKSSQQITLDDIEGWESRNGSMPQGAIVAIRRGPGDNATSDSEMPITAGAAQFLMDARYTLGFAVENSADLSSDRTLARQIALHGDYVVERAARMTSLPETGSLVIVAPPKSKNAGDAGVRVLAMVR